MKKILSSNGKVLTNGLGVLSYKSYSKYWGFHQAKQDGTTAAYDYIYKCLKDGFSVPERDGGIYDGENASIYHINCHWLTIPFSSFGLTKEQAYKVLSKVCDDNGELLASVYLPEFDSPDNTVIENGIVQSTRICLAVDSERSEALATMKTVVNALDEKIAECVDGVTINRLPTTVEQKKKVVKIIHDWILKKSDFATRGNTSYWQITAFSPLSSIIDVGATGYAGKPVQCSGISRAMQYMCRRYGINCVYVMGGYGSGTGGASSDEKNNHAWNLVDLIHPVGVYIEDENTWAGLDATFDESISDGEKTGEGLTPWTYFLDSEETYHDSANERVNNDMGYPVDKPAANYIYTPTDAEHMYATDYYSVDFGGGANELV